MDEQDQLRQYNEEAEQSRDRGDLPAAKRSLPPKRSKRERQYVCYQVRFQPAIFAQTTAPISEVDSTGSPAAAISAVR